MVDVRLYHEAISIRDASTLPLFRELLDQVALLERTLTKSPSHPFTARKPTQLEPMNSLGGDKLLQLVMKLCRQTLYHTYW